MSEASESTDISGENLKYHIQSFQKLLQHAISRFSTKRLFSMLRIAMRANMAAAQPVLGSTPSPLRDPTRISSMRELREIVGDITDRIEGRGLAREEDIALHAYFTTFFEDLGYLRDLKKYFDKNIYSILVTHFYDPSSDMDLVNKHISTNGYPRTPPTRSGTTSTPPATRGTGLETVDEEDEEEIEHNLADLSESKQLKHTVNQMHRTNNKWDKLLYCDFAEKSLFDPDSHHEIIQFRGYERFECVLRTVPDIFVKSYKSIEIAKLWCELSEKVYQDPEEKDLLKLDFNQRMAALEVRVKELVKEIRADEENLLVQRLDLDKLNDRDTRSDDLRKNYTKIEEKKNATEEKYNFVKERRDDLVEEMKELKKESTEYEHKGEELKDCNRQLTEIGKELALLNYKLSLLEGDYHLELELRPELIRYIVQVEASITALQQSIKEKMETKAERELQLGSMKEHCGKMREIMDRYIPKLPKRPLTRARAIRYRSRPNTTDSHATRSRDGDNDDDGDEQDDDEDDDEDEDEDEDDGYVDDDDEYDDQDTDDDDGSNMNNNNRSFDHKSSSCHNSLNIDEQDYIAHAHVDSDVIVNVIHENIDIISEEDLSAFIDGFINDILYNHTSSHEADVLPTDDTRNQQV